MSKDKVKYYISNPINYIPCYGRVLNTCELIFTTEDLSGSRKTRNNMSIYQNSIMSAAAFVFYDIRILKKYLILNNISLDRISILCDNDTSTINKAK